MLMNKSLLFVLLSVVVPVAPVEIAITIDDHPMYSTGFMDIQTRTENICSALEKRSIQAVFFCVGERVDDLDVSHMKRIEHGNHFIANHSYTHGHPTKMTYDQFLKELVDTENSLKGFANYRKWFRYPFLDYGDRQGDLQRKRDYYNLIKQHGYQEGYVTINTFDWHVNNFLNAAHNEGKTIDFEKLKRFYVDLIVSWCKHYIAEYEGSGKVHTLLLHAFDINGLYMDEILEEVAKLGTIVSPEKAFTDVSWRDPYFLDSEPFPYADPETLDMKVLDQMLEKAEIIK